MAECHLSAPIPVLPGVAIFARKLSFVQIWVDGSYALNIGSRGYSLPSLIADGGHNLAIKGTREALDDKALADTIGPAGLQHMLQFVTECAKISNLAVYFA